MEPTSAPRPTRAFGRYLVYPPFAAGGMATVHMGRLLGPVGFSRIVAIKQLHAYLAADPDFVSMLLDEARLAARIHHPNVVQTLDVVSAQGELFVVLEYIAGESLDRLLRTAKELGEPPSPAIVASILFGVLQGLHAAHEARDARGEPLEIVHRDLSPQNLLVGTDGVARVLDFGVAKARGRAQTTRDGQVKGKLAYMAPEQLRGDVTRRTDIFAASIVLWEALSGERLFRGDHDGEIINKLLEKPIPSPREYSSSVTQELEAVVLRGLQHNPEDRFATAREMARALENAGALATPLEVGAWVERMAGHVLDARAKLIAAIEAHAGEDDVLEPERRSPVPLAVDMTNARAPFDSLTTNTAPVPGLASELDDAPTEKMSAERIEPDLDRDVLQPPVGSGRRRRAGVLVAGAAIALAAIAFATLPARAPLAERAGELTSATTPTESRTIAPPPASTPANEDEAPSEPEVPAPEAEPTTRSPAKAGARARPVPRNKHVACSPPYTVDAKGLRHYKPECL